MMRHNCDSALWNFYFDNMELYLAYSTDPRSPPQCFADKDCLNKLFFC